jgi:hypothetical protein
MHCCLERAIKCILNVVTWWHNVFALCSMSVYSQFVLYAAHMKGAGSVRVVVGSSIAFPSACSCYRYLCGVIGMFARYLTVASFCCVGCQQLASTMLSVNVCFQYMKNSIWPPLSMISMSRTLILGVLLVPTWTFVSICLTAFVYSIH